MIRKPRSGSWLGVAVRAAGAASLMSLATNALAQQAAENYAQALADADDLRRHNAHIERLLAAQQDQLESLEAQIAGLDATAAALPSLLERMFDSLAEFVAADLPFLPEERADRLNRLGALMAGDDVGPAEKYRRLLEAFQIELEYGRNMAAYRGTLADGREADFVRLGRVSLMYRTVDGTEAGYWDSERGEWVADRRYARAIDEALNIANEVTAPDLVILPVPAPEETRS